MSRVAQTRVTAYDVLRDVDDRDAYANLALPAKLKQAQLTGQDAAFVTELVAGTLRRQGFYDAVLTIAAKRPVAELDARTRRVLRLGVHQLLSMRVPAHAAINEAVELERLVANKKAAGFVNGVLRNISRRSQQEWIAQVRDAAPTTDAALAAEHSHPEWIVRALREALSVDDRKQELTELLVADNTSPKVNLVLLPESARSAGQLVEEALAELPDNLRQTGISPYGVELTGLPPEVAISKLAAAGIVARVQDQGSQLAALALLAAKPFGAGERWLDLCAGPGGKTALLAAGAASAGATLHANEVSAHRSKLVERAVAAHSDVVTFSTADGTTAEAFAGGLFDRVLVDAPCSGLGALRRRPEARWRKLPGDIPALVKLQEQLLEAAIAHLQPGGVLAYVTCSPHLAETRIPLRRIQSAHPELSVLDVRAVLREAYPDALDARSGIAAAGSTASGEKAAPLQLWPHVHESDAMFIALLQKP